MGQDFSEVQGRPVGPDQVWEGFVEAVGLLYTLKDGHDTNREQQEDTQQYQRHEQNPRGRKAEDIGINLSASEDGSWGREYGRIEKDKIKNTP